MDPVDRSRLTGADLPPRFGGGKAPPKPHVPVPPQGSGDAIAARGPIGADSAAALARAAATMKGGGSPADAKRHAASGPPAFGPPVAATHASELALAIWPSFVRARSDIVRYLSRRYREELVPTPEALDLALASHGPLCRFESIEVDGTPVGLIAWYPRADVFEVSYWLDPVQRGRGLAGLALYALLRTIFAASSARAVRARVHPANLASQRVLAKCGFVQLPIRGLAGGLVFAMTPQMFAELAPPAQNGTADPTT